jgi:hypothetical protein
MLTADNSPPLNSAQLINVNRERKDVFTGIRNNAHAKRTPYSPTELSRRIPSPGMLHRVALVRTDVSEESIASIITVKTISELGTTLAVTVVLTELLKCIRFHIYYQYYGLNSTFWFKVLCGSYLKEKW